MSIDPAGQYASPYVGMGNNPVSRVDPDGGFDTRYEDEAGKLLLETHDGSSAIVTIADDQFNGFAFAVAKTTAGNLDSKDWNKAMKSYYLGFELTDGHEASLNLQHSDWARRKVIRAWQPGSNWDFWGASFAEAASQWTDPFLVTGAFHIAITPRFKPLGRAGSAAPKGNIYSVAFQMQLKKGANGTFRATHYMHFKQANTALAKMIKSNPEVAKAMIELGVDVPRFPSGEIMGASPDNWVWHHHTQAGFMQLVPKGQHPSVPGGIFWDVLHPFKINGQSAGGYALWGK